LEEEIRRLNPGRVKYFYNIYRKAPSRPYTNYKGKQSNNFPKRERFNSDGNQPTNNHNKYTIPKSNEKEYNSSHEEIEIDMTNVKYPFTSKIHSHE
jgi:hypothetical protein